MTDRQVTESTIGLAGRLSHLPYGLTKAEDCGWQSTRNFAQRTPVFKELGLHKIWRPTTSSTGVQSPSSLTSKARDMSRKQQKWLLKANPEARLGNECIRDELLASHSSSQAHESELWSSSLFAIGELTDTSDPQRVSGAPLVAIVTGEANDVLRLAKPGVEEWQWRDDDNVILGFGDLTEEDDSVLFREEFAGPIRRLKSVVDSKRYDPTRWIVVQRDSGTRVFQPEYRLAPTISSYDRGGKISRIAANPLLFLSKNQTGGNSHSDFSFNPGVRSKPPQLGLIDECGFWSIWDVTHKARSSRKPKVHLSKCGHIEQGVMSCLPSKGTGEPQWHKMLWVGCSSDNSQEFILEEDADNPEAQGPFSQLVRSSTLLLCNAKLIRLLDLENNSVLPSLPFIAERGRDYVLDVHQNPRDTGHFFVLTTSKLFVVRVHSVPRQDWGNVQKQWNIVMAISHLRDGFDLSLKLTVAPGAALSERTTSLISIYSSRNIQVDLFCVTIMKSDPSTVAYHSESVILDALRHTSPETAPTTMCVHPIQVALRPSKLPTQFARNLATQHIQFYQLAVLRRDMCLASSLCVSTFSLSTDRINRPDHKVTRTKDPAKERKRLLKDISARFIVPDDVNIHGGEGEHGPPTTEYVSRWAVTQRPITIFYEHLRTFFDEIREYQELPAGDEGFGYNPFDDAHIAIGRVIEDGNMPISTIFQMIENLRLPNDMSLAASDWRIEIERLGRVNSNVALLALNRPHTQIFGASNSLDDLHSTLLVMAAGANFGDESQRWMQETRSKVIRQITCDVYLSLFGLVHRQVNRQIDLNEFQRSLAHDLDNMVIDSQQGSRAGSVARSQSEVSATSSKEPNSENAPEEDPAMTLLRSYTGTGKFVPNKSTALLDKWEIGANPDNYMFDLDIGKEVTPGMQRRAKKLARESRKRRRAETLLQIPKDQEPSLPATQPAPNTHFSSQFSQPIGGYSSQPIKSDLPHTMSQPIPGIFGRRDERPKKKVKKRKSGF
ncbi:hypothetical protein F4781DRAFT_432549 [Annulohypoxylon bovei var. microspora]|nr:hypothetical protein F4781DRAFT_432549 [Annulohypoxylon bovei var. microspora]